MFGLYSSVTSLQLAGPAFLAHSAYKHLSLPGLDLTVALPQYNRNAFVIV